jgi:hypothetical protein
MKEDIRVNNLKMRWVWKVLMMIMIFKKRRLLMKRN